MSLQTFSTQKPQVTPGRCVNARGFSVHAEVRLGINQRHKLEARASDGTSLARPRTQHLCRYITRPAYTQPCRAGRASTEDAQ